MAALLSVFGFIIMLGLLIFIHEFGHFLFAKMFGVRVDVFSLGFYGRIFSFRWGETRYQIGWLPLGGYVKMFGDAEVSEIPPHLRHCAFACKPLWQRALIVFAGPFANIVVLPLMALGVIYLLQGQAVSTTIGSVIPGYPAAKAGLQAGDRIDAVNGTKTRYFRDLLHLIGDIPGKHVQLRITRGKRQFDVKIIPRTIEEDDAFGSKKKRGIIGITADFRTPTVGISDPKSPAYRAGLRTWDRIIAVNGTPIRRWEELVRFRQSHPKGPHKYTVQRTLRIHNPALRFRHPMKPHTIVVHPATRLTSKGKAVYWDGIHSSELFVKSVRTGTPLAKAGIQVGDRLLKLGGKTLQIASDLGSLPNKKDAKYTIVYERKGKITRRSFTLFEVTFVDPLKQRHKRTLLGIQLGMPYERGVKIPITSPVSFAFRRAAQDTWFFSGLLVRVIKKLFTQEISSDNIGGPIMIFQIAQEAVKSGWEIFLRHLALISINLGIVNLLPIPLLDGGHLLFFLIEGVIRRPVPPKIKESAFLLGLIFLLFLFLLAIKNDLQRLFSG